MPRSGKPDGIGMYDETLAVTDIRSIANAGAEGSIPRYRSLFGAPDGPDREHSG